MKIHFLTIISLSTGTDRSEQTVKTQIRCHHVASYLGLHCLLLIQQHLNTSTGSKSGLLHSLGQIE